MKEMKDTHSNNGKKKEKKKGPSIVERISSLVEYCWTGVWKETKNTFKVRAIKTINLSVMSFLDRDLQMKSAALTYYTVLAIVPAFALLFAIGRGFGFQNLLEDELYGFFPAQREAVKTALGFVDSYLKESGQGIFVGVGIVMLLWTLVSLLSTIEDTFNFIWGIKSSRSIYQKLTDYISICLIIPVLMVCSSGVSIFMSTMVQSSLHLSFLTPIVNLGLETTPWILTWAAFALSYWLIPNTKVNFKYAAISGGICAVAYMVVQMLFVSGQLYVTKFNAIYGSFAFLPLLLVWLQISWLILLFGCVLTYSMQNVFVFNYLGDSKEVSHDYMRKVALVLAGAITKRFIDHRTPLTRNELSMHYDLPLRLVGRIEEILLKAGMIYHVVLNEGKVGLCPAYDCQEMNVKQLFDVLDRTGSADFIPRFNELYREIVTEADKWNEEAWSPASETLLKDLPVEDFEEEENSVSTTADEDVTNLSQ